MKGRYATQKDGLGVAIIALGILAMVMPWGSAAVATSRNGKSDPYAILIGTLYVLGSFIIIAGFAVLGLKDHDDNP